MPEATRPSAKRLWYSPRQAFKRLILYALIAYVTICVYLYLEQNSLEYPRTLAGVALARPEAEAEARQARLAPWDHPTPGAQSPQGYVPPDFMQPARGTIVVFHGNGAWAGQEDHYVDAFTRRGFRTFLYEYPGYGGRPGTPSEKGIVPDARALIRSLDRRGLGPIYVWGESLGSGVAAAVCADADLPVRGLVLLTAWDTVANVGLYRYPFIPIPWLMTDRYDSVANLEHFQHPICVIRGTIDPVIPAALTTRLYDHLPEPKKMIVQEGYGHGDWPDSPGLKWWDDALDFITGK